GADAAAPRYALAVLPVVGHRREAHAVLAGRADGDRVGVAALGFTQRVHGLARRPAPELARRLHLGARLGHRQVRRRRGTAASEPGAEASALECRGEAPAEGRIEEEAGQRRLAGDAGAAVAGHGRVGDRPHTEDDRVIRRERVRAGRNPVVEQARREAVAAQEPSGRALAERLDTRRARREVDVQDAAAVTLQRPMSFSPLRAASTRSAGAPVCAISLRYTTSAASICLSAVKLVPAASSARRPVGDSGATYAAVM